MNNDFKHWNLLNYEYIKNNARILSKEARLRFSNTKSVRYVGKTKVSYNQREYIAPVLMVDIAKFLGELNADGFHREHTRNKSYNGTSPLFMYFVLAQVLFDKIIELMVDIDNTEFFGVLQRRCMYRYLMLYVSHHFSAFSEPSGEAAASLRIADSVPIVLMDVCTPKVHMLIGPHSQTPQVYSKMDPEIEFDLNVAIKHKTAPISLAIH